MQVVHRGLTKRYVSMLERLSHVGSMREAIPRQVRCLPLHPPSSFFESSILLRSTCSLPLRDRMIEYSITGRLQSGTEPGKREPREEGGGFRRLKRADTLKTRPEWAVPGLWRGASRLFWERALRVECTHQGLSCPPATGNSDSNGTIVDFWYRLC